MTDLPTWVGLVAAIFTTICHLPQLVKVWRTRETDDISLKMLLALGLGLGLWTTYGVMRGDLVIIGANAVSLGLVGAIASFKLLGSK
jgi:MtN3 and saliva related transmembrane protein